MLVRVDILDDRLEAIEADDDRERLRLYLELWREGAVDPLRDPGTVLIFELDDGARPRRLVANDGLPKVGRLGTFHSDRTPKGTGCAPARRATTCGRPQVHAEPRPSSHARARGYGRLPPRRESPCRGATGVAPPAPSPATAAVPPLGRPLHARRGL